ncbi:MAG: DUF6125 family protein [Candidatus Kapaibacteriota bacterium]|jgi:hypothetical protein
MEAQNIESLDKQQLLELLKIYAKNWLAHDGCWFLAIESKLGIDKAIEFDRDAWEQFTQIEARRIIDFLKLGNNSGLDGLQRALKFRLYSTINEQYSVFTAPDELVHYVKTCRVQEARRRKGLPDFPCKSVGIVEYSLFAKTIDSRIETEVVSCPPDITNENFYCIWKFKIKQ